MAIKIELENITTATTAANADKLLFSRTSDGAARLILISNLTPGGLSGLAGCRLKNGNLQLLNSDTSLWHTVSALGTPPQIALKETGEP